jgi:uncharacterized repeat protein (TIGR01451 family)
VIPRFSGQNVRWLALPALLLALLLLSIVPRALGAPTPATLQLLDTAPAYQRVSLTMPNGQGFSAAPGWFRLRVTPAGGTAVERRGFCVDPLHAIATGTGYQVRLLGAADDPSLATPRMAEAAWLIERADALIGAAANDDLEAGALQVAVWQLAGQVRESSPTGDAALNARTTALRALAAGRAPGGPMTIAAEAGRRCAGSVPVALTLTGAPGSTATLAVTAGTGTVSPAEVRFSTAGTATAAVSSAASGSVTVTARAEGGALTRAARAQAGQTTPQETAMLVPASHAAAVTVAFEDCPLVPSFRGGEQPVVPPAPSLPDKRVPEKSPSTPAPHEFTATPPFSVVKSGPARVRAGSVAQYAIRVINRGRTVLRGMRVVDLLPPGMSLASVPAGSTLRGGRLVWSLRALSPGASRTLRVRVRLDADASGRSCNRATVTVPGAGSRTATACSHVVATPVRILPAVTS